MQEVFFKKLYQVKNENFVKFTLIYYCFIPIGLVCERKSKTLYLKEDFKKIEKHTFFQDFKNNQFVKNYKTLSLLSGE